MNRKNDTCPICQSEIDNTLKVVCPTCGTPHHRECYMQNGRCANDELHSEGFVYEREPDVRYEAENKSLVCKGCNNPLPDTAIFCPNCATPVFEKQPNGQFGNRQQSNQQYGYNPFVPPPIFKDPNRKIDGVSAMDISLYTKNSSEYFINSFGRQRGSLNFAAAILGPIYLFYRKLYLHAAILMVLQVIISIPSFLSNIVYLYPNIDTSKIPSFFQTILEISSNNAVSAILWILSLALTVIPLIMTNKLYKKKTYDDINEINNKYADDEVARRFALSKKGGVDIASTIVCIIVLGFIYLFLINSILGGVTNGVGGIIA